METPQDIIEIEIATVGAASPTEVERPVAVADVAEAGGPVVTGTRFRSVTDEAGAGGPAVTGTGGPVVTATRFRSVTDVAEASGPAVTGAGGPVITGMRFRSVTDVADSSPLTVIGKIDLDVVFPGLKCSMCCVVASIGSDGLLGTEALQLCLPHQLDLRTGLLWVEGRSTLQLHQQKPTPYVRGLLLTAVVLPPDSEVVAPFSLNGGQLGSCALIVLHRDLTEEFGVVVGHTLVDASTSSANVLIINPNAEEVVLPCRTSIGQLVLISAVSVARSEVQSLANTAVVRPEYLEDIVKGSHNSLGDTGRQSLRELLLRYEHVFPAPGDPVTGRTKSVQHEIIAKDARPVRCGPRRLAPAGLRKEQDCAQDMLTGGQIEPSDSPWASPVVLVTKKDGLTRFLC